MRLKWTQPHKDLYQCKRKNWVFIYGFGSVSIYQNKERIKGIEAETLEKADEIICKIFRIK